MNQTSLLDMEQAKQRGLDRAEAHSQRFVDVMREHAMCISNVVGMVSTDDLRPLADKLGQHPHSPNSWGSVFRGPEWEHIGWKKSDWPGNHRRHIQVWKYRALQS